MGIDRKNLCPNCGAKLTGMELKCPECGYILSVETAGGEKTTESILVLQDKLSAVDKVFSVGASASRKKATIINSFPISNTVGELLRLLHLSYSNYEASREVGDKKLMIAWLGKALESYRRLREMQDDASVTEALQKYDVLADSKAFSKLSGSYAKKRWLVGLSILFVLLLGAFGYFWGADILVRMGNTKGAVWLLSQTGRQNKVIDLMVQNELLEEAADLMFQEGNVLQSVSILAQKGLIKQALILAGRTGSREAIDNCLDEIEKFSKFATRERIYMQEKSVLTNSIKTTFDEDDPYRVKEIRSLTDDAIIWYDVWGIFKEMSFPKPHLFYDSEFLYHYIYSDVETMKPFTPEVTRNDRGKIVEIKIPSWGMDYKCEYSRYGKINIERSFVLNTGKLYSETIYEYYKTSDYLSRVHVRYLFDEKISGYQHDKYDSYIERFEFENGQTTEASQTLDYNGLVTRKVIIEYYDNMEILYRYEYSSNMSKLEPISVNVNYYIDNEHIECLTLAELK